MKKTILVVEDEPKVANTLKNVLEENNYTVSVAYDGLIGKQLVHNNYYDLIILDVNLPLLNGYELCKIIKQKNEMLPIIMLTALGSIDDKILGFNVGADDYISKPFELRELLARIKVHLKKNVVQKQNQNLICIADLEIDLDKRQVKRAGKNIDLTAKEYQLLEFLLINRGKIVSRVEIAEKIWEQYFDSGTNVIDVYINYLRNKIDKDFDNKLIHTVIGMGYMIKEE